MIGESGGSGGSGDELLLEQPHLISKRPDLVACPGQVVMCCTQFFLRVEETINTIKVFPLSMKLRLVRTIAPFSGKLVGCMLQLIPRLEKKSLEGRTSASDFVIVIHRGPIHEMT